MPLILKQTSQYQCDFRFQHKHRPLPVIISLSNNNTLHVSLPIPVRSICPGQVKKEKQKYSLTNNISFSFLLYFSMQFSMMEMKY